MPYANSLSFLLSQVGAHSARRFAEALVGAGLTPREFAALSNLVEFGPRNQQQLADELGMHRNNVVALVDALEAAKLVRRERNPRDRRSFVLQLTATGRRRLERAARIVPDLDHELGAVLTKSEQAALVRALQTLADTAGLTPGIHPHLASNRHTDRT